MKRQRAVLSNILRSKPRPRTRGRGKDFSDFEKDVYKAVTGIPKGHVRSYKWVAKEIGAPKAYRAVGNALNKNLYPGPIPCHRVIKSDGTIGGYAKGARSKRSLLKSEGVDVG